MYHYLSQDLRTCLQAIATDYIRRIFEENKNRELTGVKFGAIETKEKYFYKIVKEYGENEVATNL